MTYMLSPTSTYVVIDKKLGQTPLQTLKTWKQENPEYLHIPATYAGRLDPMAEGKLLILLGDECKKQDTYRGLDKEYEIEVLLDLSTDTGDVLGLPLYEGKRASHRSMASVLKALTGSKEVPYPAFSSKTVNGKPLFLYCLEGSLSTIKIPTHIETIYSIKEVQSQQISKEVLQTRIQQILSLAPRSEEPSKTLGANFRQDEIRASWNAVFSEMQERNFAVLTLLVTCASGSYMRTLAERIAKALDTTGMALSIKRTRVGRYQNILGISLWTKEYR